MTVSGELILRISVLWWWWWPRAVACTPANQASLRFSSLLLSSLSLPPPTKSTSSGGNLPAYRYLHYVDNSYSQTGSKVPQLCNSHWKSILSYKALVVQFLKWTSTRYIYKSFTALMNPAWGTQPLSAQFLSFSCNFRGKISQNWKINSQMQIALVIFNLIILVYHNWL